MIVFDTADERFEWKRTLLAGHSGVWTSRAASSWPRPLYVRFVSGVPELGDRAVSFTVVSSVDDLLRVLDAVGNSNTTEPFIAASTQEPIDLVVETLVIDAMHHLEALLGADDKKARVLMEAISPLPVHVVLLCRLTHKEGRQFPLTCLNGALLNYVDVALAVEDDHFQAHPDDRLPWVLDRSGLLPSTVPLTFTDDYARLARALGVAAGDQDLSAPAPQSVAPPLVSPLPAAPPAAAPAVSAPPAAAPAPPVGASQPVPAPVAAPAPVASPEEQEAPEEGDPDLPMCTSQGRLGNGCLGRVESIYARDVSVIRFRRPMCGPCNDKEYEAVPKKIAAPRKAPGPAPDGTVPGRPRDEDIAVVPHGEVIGQVRPPSDQDLRAFLTGPSS